MFTKPPTAAQANGDNFVLGIVDKVFGWPGRIQGMLFNAMINTIDRVQTDQAMKETKEMIEREKQQKETEKSD
jgi:hypothetical protein